MMACLLSVEKKTILNWHILNAKAALLLLLEDFKSTGASNGILEVSSEHFLKIAVSSTPFKRYVCINKAKTGFKCSFI